MHFPGSDPLLARLNNEASQILPADAIPTLLRGKQAIVAGDPYQLPPTTFFIAGVADPLDDSVDDSAEDEPLLSSEAQDALDAGRSIALTRDHGSVLDVMRTLLPPPHGTKTLGWHYRSQDERLITFSNSRPSLYDWSLTTFPGARGEESIRHVLVPFQSGSGGPTASVSQEVDKVVDLIIEHARQRPKESLGVVALGVRHADRISERLRVELSNYQEYEEFFGEEKAEPFFIKNLERVQGDERDSIILTVGYGKTTDGRMRYNFGPVNQDGGDRRLNVAITRARRSMAVVSSFSGREMDPDHLHGRGPQMLRDYLLYAESGGNNLGLVARDKPTLNPFERDVFEHLSRRGISLIPRFGQSGYWIDFAAMHPERKSEPVLAIESDGAQYHSSMAARDKDRLREQHLGRLGWKFHRIWSTDWFRFREREIERAFNEYEQAISNRDSQISNGGDEDAIPDKSAELKISAEPTEPLRRAWPGIRRGLSIADYSINDLRSVVRWVQSDGLLRTQDQIEYEVRKALGFKRRGSKIVEEIRKAINAERV